jgi:membrane protein implicated in regulation of membrane protease activity
MVISTLIAGLLAAALGPAALYRGTLVPTFPWPATAAAITATALLLAGAVRRRRTALALVPALRRGRRR